MRRVTTATGALLALAGTALLTVWSLTGLVDQAAAPGQASLNTLLGLGAGVGAAGCGLWLAAGAVLTVLGSAAWRPCQRCRCCRSEDRTAGGGA